MARIKVNISCPEVWDFDQFLKSHSPNQQKVWGEYEFFLNQESGFFDFWIVLEQLEKNTKLQVAQGGAILVTMEEKDVKPTFNPKFLNQFDQVITSRDDINHSNVLLSHYFTKWHVMKSYDELKAACDKPITNKTKQLSAIISSRVQYGTHQRRYAFINKMQGHFKDGLDWYSKNENPLTDKWDGLSDYRYSIAVENGSHPRYFTEKIVDVILADSIPIYWGAPDICDYFPQDLIKNIDIKDYQTCIQQIEVWIAQDDISYSIPLLRESKLKILDEYQFYPWLVNILKQKSQIAPKYLSQTIYKEEQIEPLTRIKKVVKKIIGYDRV
jgi:hypothetical protein